MHSQRRRAINAPHLAALVRAGTTFKNGVLDKPDDASPSHEEAA